MDLPQNRSTRYLEERKEQGGDRKSKPHSEVLKSSAHNIAMDNSLPHSEEVTSLKIANQSKVSPKTVRNADVSIGRPKLSSNFTVTGNKLSGFSKF